MRPALAAVALAVALPALAQKPAVPSKDDVAKLQRETLLLRQQAELAKGKEFYLLLDPAAQTLSLNLRGATLQTWTVVGIEAGAPRVAFVSRGLPDEWEGRVWQEGTLDPERPLDRFELEAPPVTAEGTEVAVPIPPTPEEKYPVPPRYHIRFAGGLSIEVIPPGRAEEAGFWKRLSTGFSTWWHDFRQAVSSEPEDKLRLRLTLGAKEADSLYRALPPNTKLMVVPPAS
ncbi:MAG TPA: hypothetical protein VF139_16510 [Candidatus Polarisedimenticolaceae bacterium]